MKIRNKSNDRLIIGLGFYNPRGVDPGDTIDVPDDVADNYLFHDDGIPGEFDDDGVQKYRQVPSDLWEAADIPTPVPVEVPVEEAPVS